MVILLLTVKTKYAVGGDLSRHPTALLPTYRGRHEVKPQGLSGVLNRIVV
jgi:hypothetical protein